MPLGSSDLLLLVCSAFPCRLSQLLRTFFLSLPTREPVILPLLLGSAPGRAPPSATRRGGGFPILLSRSALDDRHMSVCLSASPSPPNLLSFSYFHSSDFPWCLEPKRSLWLFPPSLSTGLVASAAARSFQPTCLDCCLTLSYLGGRHGSPACRRLETALWTGPQTSWRIWSFHSYPHSSRAGSDAASLTNLSFAFS